jgi:hypothetical protein
MVLSLTVVDLVLAGCAAPRVTTKSLLGEMTDLAALAEYPNPPFTCKQFSSYDRAAKSPEEKWFANADRGQYLRVEDNAGRKEYVMMDADGPGAVVRIWSANPQGTLRIYLDHAETPVIEAPLADLLSGKVEGIPEPIAHVVARGWNSYFPIPYAEHCKITSDKGDFYYHVNYRTYPAQACVTTFEPADFEALQTEITQVAARLSSPRRCAVEPAEVLSQAARQPGEALLPGQAFTWEKRGQGSGAIVGIRVHVDAEDITSALRQLVLTMKFDGEETVACPLGDFFGAAPGVNAYESLPLGVTADGVMWSHWVMPFHESAFARIENQGEQAVRVSFRIAGSDYKWTDRSMHFHAKWRGEFDVPTRPMQDWNYMTAEGKGVFVGAAFHIGNPVKNWWGEGDEKIYVDGETFPSHFGTGTEDYYGYAWCCPELFTHAYHNQPRCDGPGNYGHTAVNRWHIIDRIPFEKNFRFDMELWHWHAETKVSMSVVTYWYARPGATDGFPKIDPADLRVVEIPKYEPPRVKGALEGEEMTVIQKTGILEPQEWGGLSNEKHRWWREGQPGDRLVLGFDVTEGGEYRVFARFLKARDYGIVRLSINDQKAGNPIDLYNPNVLPSKEIELGTFNLHAGQNTLTAEIVGANEKAAKAYMFGLDYLRLASTH